LIETQKIEADPYRAKAKERLGIPLDKEREYIFNPSVALISLSIKHRRLRQEKSKAWLGKSDKRRKRHNLQKFSILYIKKASMRVKMWSVNH